MTGVAELSIFSLALGLVGGLALFLFGLDQMTSALKMVAGERLRFLLARLTVNRLSGLFTGAFVTAIIQSSSVTTVLVVSFISSGLMSLSQAVGVILGANIGTTVTAQILAFKVTGLAPLLVAVGFALNMLSPSAALRQHGRGIFGLGLVFLGMLMMSEAMEPLRSHAPFVEWMTRMERPVLGILAGALFTALVQSSSATTGVVIAMASQGLLSLPAGIALILGANVGTCVTAGLASIGRPREAVRAALVHVIFNVAGVALWLRFIPELAWASELVSPAHSELAGSAQLGAAVPRQIANAHTAFNLINALLFLPFGALLARLSERLVPDRPMAAEDEIRTQFLDDALLDTPFLALERVRLELRRLGELVSGMLDAILPVALAGSRVELDGVERMDRQVDQLYDRVVNYLAEVSQRSLSEAETQELVQLMDATNALESIGDIIETDLVRRGRERLDSDVVISERTREVIAAFHGQVAVSLREAVEAVVDRDVEDARRVIERKPEMQEAAEAAARHGAARLVAPEQKRIVTYAIESDILEDLRRIFYYAKRIAKGVIETQEDESEE